MATLIQARSPLSKTYVKWIVWDEQIETIQTFKAKIAAIFRCHELGEPLQSQWKFPTLFADKMLWLPDCPDKSGWDAATKTFTFTGAYPDSSDDPGVWHYIKDTTIAPDVPTPEQVIASAGHLGLRGLSILSDADLKQLLVIATWLSKLPDNIGKGATYYPSNEVANYIEVFSSHYLDTPTTISNDLVLAVADAMGISPSFKSGTSVKTIMRHKINHVGALLLPQKLPATLYDYSAMHLYRFSERFEKMDKRKSKIRTKIYEGPDVADVLASFKKMQKKTA